MSGGCERELEHLRGLKQKYGAHCVRKYFGFSFKDIADYMGIYKAKLSDIVSGRIKMNEVLINRFIEAYKHFDIENRTKDFKESEEQLWWRNHWTRQRNYLTRLILFFIIIPTMVSPIFLKSCRYNFPEYILC